MQLIVLGCSGSLPGPGAAASGYLVEAEGFRLVVDLGNGTLAELQSYCNPFEVGALLVSHLHPDHCADFTALTVLRRYHPQPLHDPRQHRLAVYAPAGAPTRFAAAYAPSGEERLSTDLGDVFDFRPLRAGTIHIGPFEVTSAPMAHLCDTYGFRIMHSGRSLVYTGDTGRCDALVELAADADVLLSEASWPHDGNHPPNVHMSGREAGEVAVAAGVRRLLLTHIQPWTNREAMLAEAAEVFAGPVSLVEQGKTYTI